MVKEGAVPSYDPVERFRYRGESGKVVIKAKEPSHSGHERQGGEDRTRSADYLAPGHHQLDRLAEILTGNLRKSLPRLLRWGIVHSVARQLVPVLNPDPAEATVAVIQHKRIVGHA